MSADTDEDGQTALHFAASLYIAEILLNAGANVDARALEEVTPLRIAAQEGKDDVVAVLLAAGADIDSVDHQGATPPMQEPIPGVKTS